MRVTDRPDGERGAIAVMVALFSTVSIACASLTLDLGNVWQRQRQMHTATDAAALAVAQDNALDADGCASLADSYVSANDEGLDVTGCTAADTSESSGYVTVQGDGETDFRFAGVGGSASVEHGSSTTAEWGQPAGAYGVRPIAVCEFVPAVAAWLNAPFGPTGVSAPIQVPYTSADQGCENAPGNWDLLDFDGGGGGSSELRDRLLDGYEGLVSVPSLLPPYTGHVSNIKSVLDELVLSGEVFPISLFDLVAGTGDTAEFHAVAVVNVRLVGFNISGSPTAQHLTFEFQPGIVVGPCCGTGPDTGARVVRICAVNRNPRKGECGL